MTKRQDGKTAEFKEGRMEYREQGSKLVGQEKKGKLEE